MSDADERIIQSIADAELEVRNTEPSPFNNGQARALLEALRSKGIVVAESKPHSRSMGPEYVHHAGDDC